MFRNGRYVASGSTAGIGILPLLAAGASKIMGGGKKTTTPAKAPSWVAPVVAGAGVIVVVSLLLAVKR